MTSGLDDQAALEERQQRESFLDFLLGILDLDPSCRCCPHHIALPAMPMQMASARFCQPLLPAMPTPSISVLSLTVLSRNTLIHVSLACSR